MQALGIGSGDFVRLDPGAVETLTGSQTGIYNRSGVTTRVAEGEFLALECGYSPGA